MFTTKFSLIIVSMIMSMAVPGLRVDPVTPDKMEEKYTRFDREYYMTEEEYGYIRPGLNVEVENLTIDAENRIVVTLLFTDDMEQPLDLEGKVTPGPISPRFILAWYDGNLRQYTAYTTRSATSPITGDTAVQASSDSGGTFDILSLGRARYTFNTALPEGYDASKTHTLSIYSTRDLEEIIGKNYYNNLEYDFRPDGQPVTEQWNAFTNETCNSCHHDMGFHGGSRKSVKNCVQCHQPQSTDPDTGNTVDMKVMIHKIHMGANLPSVQAGNPYQIIGYHQTVHDYSEVVFSQDIRNCATCHRPDSPEGDIWMTRPTRAACGSCHDDIVWETGEGHLDTPQLDDSACGNCHIPQGDHEYDTSIVGAHTIPEKSSQLAGLHMEILDVTNASPGVTPTVTFRLTDNEGNFVDPDALDRLSILVGGPTVDYKEYWRESPSGYTSTGDTVTYTMETPFPADASGTYAVSADAYRYVYIDDGSEEGYRVRECAFNPIYYVELGTSRAVEARRDVVSLEKCNVCHDRLALHGGQRFAMEECVICHHALESDISVRPEEELPEESVHLKWLIHRLHTGHELENDFTVYGHGGREHNYNHVGYPGLREYCEACHIEETYYVPLPEGTLDTITKRDYYSPMKPAAAACLSCHSTVDAAAHAYVSTAPFGESCASCHGEERDYSVGLVHSH